MGKLDKLLQRCTNIVFLFFLVLLSFKVSLNFIYRLFKKVNEDTNLLFPFLTNASQYGNRKPVSAKTQYQLEKRLSKQGK